MNVTSLLFAVLSWCKANPTLLAAVVTAVASLFVQKLDKYPRMHALFSLFAHAGVNVPGITNAFVRLVTGRAVVAAAAPLALVLCLVGCGGSQASVQSPALTLANARAAVSVAADAWTFAASACTDLASDAGDAGTPSCAEPLMIAHDLIISAATAVDTSWNQSAACDLAQATFILTTAVPLTGTAKQFTSDAYTVAQALAGVSCTSADAGDAGGQ